MWQRDGYSTRSDPHTSPTPSLLPSSHSGRAEQSQNPPPPPPPPPAAHRPPNRHRHLSGRGGAGELEERRDGDEVGRVMAADVKERLKDGIEMGKEGFCGMNRSRFYVCTQH